MLIPINAFPRFFSYLFVYCLSHSNPARACYLEKIECIDSLQIKPNIWSELEEDGYTRVKRRCA